MIVSISAARAEMTVQSLILTGPQDVPAIAKRADWIGYPCTVSIRAGVGRTAPQNRLAQQWASDVSAQMGDRTPEEVRGYFKLCHGVPIRREDATFAATYDAMIKPLPYEAKLALMMSPIDLPVTRDMTVKELTRYLDSIQREFAPMGIHLTDPDELRFGVGNERSLRKSRRQNATRPQGTQAPRAPRLPRSRTPNALHHLRGI